MFQRESAKGMGEDEEKFDDSIDVNQTYSWHDKYRPRKPRYFNRVHTGCAAADCAPLARAAHSMSVPHSSSTYVPLANKLRSRARGCGAPNRA